MRTRKLQRLDTERKYSNIIAQAEKSEKEEQDKKWKLAEKRLLEIINKEDSNEQL